MAYYLRFYIFIGFGVLSQFYFVNFEYYFSIIGHYFFMKFLVSIELFVNSFELCIHCRIEYCSKYYYY